jgi:ABC-2 type transport system permease protein
VLGQREGALTMAAFWRIVRAIATKELRQIARDRITAALLLGVPLAQILLFGYAIDLAPRAWPMAWVADAPPSPLAEQAQQMLEADGWFRLTQHGASLADAQRAMQRGELAFIVVWREAAAPSDASTQRTSASQPAASVQHDAAARPDAQAAIGGARPDAPPASGAARPEVTLIADLSDPFAAPALGALERRFAEGDALAAVATAVAAPSDVPHAAAAGAALPVTLRLERLNAPRGGAGEYLVPALAGVILTLTLTLLAALAIVREVERGTWHGLLVTPAGASAIVLGKLLPYLGLGSVLFAALIALAHWLFGTPFGGPALWLAAGLFMVANLGLGLLLSFIARTQMQAMQMGVFFYLPSILLSGFMFPFHAMPAWARAIGECLPLTHFLRCLRASLQRGADAATVLSLGTPIALFALLAVAAALLASRRRMG